MHKIGFDAKRIVRNGTGLGSYGRTLVNALARYPINLSLYVPDMGRDDLRQQISEVPNVEFCLPSSSFTRHSSLFTSYWRSYGIVNDLKRDGIQLYHGLSGELPIGIHKSGIKTVVTIHDLIFMRHPEFYHWLDSKIYTWKFRRTIQEADHIIAISECTKRDILELGNVPENKISLIYQSCAQRFSAEADPVKISEIRALYDLPERYVLNVGSIEARKNILLAVRALPQLPADVSLVIVGRRTEYTTLVERYVTTHNLENRVKILHGVPDEHLPALYGGAEVFVYPSVYEGFGIPIIEAVRCGLPVVACSGSCLEEAGGPANLYVSPNDVDSMANALHRSLKGADHREDRIKASREYISRFDGHDVAGQVVELYNRMLS